MKVTSAVTPNDSRIVGTVLDVFCHHHLVVVPILPVLGIGDIDGVILAAFGVVGDKANWSFIDFVVEVGGVVFIIDGTLLFWEGYGSDGELGGETNRGDGVVVGC